MDAENTLKSIGLNKSEAKLYLISLELGPATAIQLAQKAGVTRQMVYTLLPQLSEKGLIKEISVGARRLFQAVNPEILNDRVKQIAANIKDIVPQLKSQQAGNTAVPLISVYENPISMREWYRAFMKEAEAGDDFLVWSAGNIWYSLDEEFYINFAKFKSAKKVNDYILARDTKEAREGHQKIASPYKQFKFIKEWWGTEADKWIWRNQIGYLTIKGNVTNLIVIESEALAAIERFDFFKIWNTVPVQD